jgi:hypothetical protein
VITSIAPLAETASSDADYQRLGLARGYIEPWEDGARTDDRPGTYEWWYFDAHLKDGTKLVVVFMDKDLATPQKPLEPMIRLNLDLADGRSFKGSSPSIRPPGAAPRITRTSASARTTRLTDEPRSGGYRTIEGTLTGVGTISRADLADALLSTLTDATSVRQSRVVTSR